MLNSKALARRVVAAGVFLFAAFCAQAGTIDITKYVYCAELEVAGHGGEGVLVDFPVLVRLSDGLAGGAFKYSDFSDAQGRDLAFADESLNELPYEIESWNRAGESLVWVKVAELAATPQKLIMYYGGDVNESNDPKAVWTRYAAVVHGGETITNSVGNTLKAYAGGNQIAATMEKGVVGGGLYKSTKKAPGVYIDNPTAVLANSGIFSISAFFMQEGGSTQILSGSQSAWGQSGYLWLLEGGSYISIASPGKHTWSGGPSDWVNKSMTSGCWYHLAFAYDYTQKKLQQYVDGRLYLESSAPGDLRNSANVFAFGSYSGKASGDSMQGGIDEIRIFNGYALPEWVAAETASMTNKNFVTIRNAGNPAIKFEVRNIKFPEIRYGAAKATMVITSLGEGARSGSIRYAVREKGSTEAFNYDFYGNVKAFVGVPSVICHSLQPGRTYEFSAYIINNRGAQSEVASAEFTTPDSESLGAKPIGSLDSLSFRSNGNATIAYSIEWPGTGATAVDLRVYAGTSEEDLKLAHELPAIRIDGETSLPGLLPGRTYFVQLVFDNGLEGGSASTDVKSLAMPAQAAIAAGAWTQGTRDSATESPAANNLLLGKLPSTYTKVYTESSSGDRPYGVNGTDGKLDNNKTMGVKSGCVLAYTFDRPATIKELRFYTHPWSGRGNINITSIQVRDSLGVTNTIADSVSRSGNNNWAFFGNASTLPVVRDAAELIVNFGTQDNDGVHYSEIEAIGYTGTMSLPLAKWGRKGNALKASIDLADIGETKHFYACLGNSWSAEISTNGWEKVIDLGRPLPGAQFLNAIAEDGGNYDFVRFVAIDENVEFKFVVSEVLRTGDAPEFGDAVAFGEIAAVSTAPGAVEAELALFSAGDDLTGAQLKFVYSHGEFSYTNLVASGAGVLGRHTVKVDDLLPGVEYVVNALLEVSGTSTPTAPVRLSTLTEDCTTPLSKINATTTSIWTTDTFTPAENNLLADMKATVEEGSYSGSVGNLTEGKAETGDNVSLYCRLPNKDNTPDSTVLRWDLATPAPLAQINFYSWWSDARAIISIDYIEALGQDGVWRRLEGSKFSAGAGKIGNCATFASAIANKNLADEVASIRVAFTNDNSKGGQYGWRSYYEVEAVRGGEPTQLYKRLAIESVVRDGDELLVHVTRPAEVAAQAGNLYVDAGENAASLDRVVLLGGFGRNETSKYVRFQLPDAAKVFRFCNILLADDNFTETTGYQFSPSFLVKEVTAYTAKEPAIVSATLGTVNVNSAVFHLNIASLGAGAASGEVVARYGTAEDDLSTETVLVSEGGGLPGEGRHVLGGLLSSTEYFAQVGVRNDLGATVYAPEVFSFTTTAGETLAAVFTGASATTAGDDTVVNFAANGSFTVTKAGWAEILLVGGGGGGGHIGGGGGGGGLVHTNLFLAPGEYSIQIGQGGAAGNASKAGGRGGDSVLKLAGSATPLLTAFGGGGGDEWDNQRPQGENFGSGGGAANTRTVVYAGTPGQGNDGGLGNTYAAGGGGGAGEPGGAGTLADSDLGHAGKGGDGLLCRITGQLLYYAGGGGGGINDRAFHLGGWGGLGGGGRAPDYNGTGVSEMNGVDGLGGGGGGASRNSYGPGKGGTGAAIIRFTPAPVKASDPAVGFGEITPGNGSVKIAAHIISTGAAAKGTLVFKYGASPAELDHALTLSENAFVGSTEYTIGNLRSLQPYYCRLVLTNANGAEASTDLRYFTTCICDDSAVDALAPRLADVEVVANRAEQTTVTGRVQGEIAADGLQLLIGSACDRLAAVAATVQIDSGDNGESVFTLATREPLELDQIYYCAVEAKNANGIDRSAIISLRTPSLKAVSCPIGWQPYIWQCNLKEVGKVKFEFGASYLGAGENHILLYLAKGNLSDVDLRATQPVASMKVDSVGKQVFSYDIPWNEIEWGAPYTYSCAMSNVYNGVSYVEPVVRQQTYSMFFSDPSTYTWTGAGDGSTWSDPSNWTADNEAAFGYPTYGSKAIFPGGTKVKVVVDKDTFVGWLDVSAAGNELEFTSPEGEFTTLTVSTVSFPGEGRTASFVFDRVRVNFNHNINYFMGPGSLIRLTNGAYVYFNGQFNKGFDIRQSKIKIVVENGSTLETKRLCLGGGDSEIVIDNSSVISYYTYFGYNSKPGTIRFKGAAPSFKVMESFTFNTTGTVSTNIFEIPAGGYASAPFVYAKNDAFLSSSVTGAGIACVIDPDSPAIKDGQFGKVPLYDAYCGIKMGELISICSDNPADKLFYRYGSNPLRNNSLNLDEPNDPAFTAPTAIWLDFGASAGKHAAEIGEAKLLAITPSSVKVRVTAIVPAASAPVAIAAILGETRLDRTLDGSTAVEFEFTGLESSRDYVMDLKLGDEASKQFAFRTLGADSKVVVGAVEGAKASVYGPYAIYVFDDPETIGELTIDQTGPAEILVVGGGGAGGCGWSQRNAYGAGGGGGGGVVHATKQYLLPGTYRVAVGRGGEVSSVESGDGQSGGDSSIVGDDFAIEAFGGGYGAGAHNVNGGPGGSGGGGAGNAKSGGASVGLLLGNAGGKSWSANETAAGGGGGAGSAGGNAVSVKEGGKGGDGYLCDITGENSYYGAGGPGAGASGNVGAKGLGYGAYGSGGRGANGGNNRFNCERGQDGVVIVRLLTNALDGAEPLVTVRSATTKSETEAEIVYEIFSLGTGAESADVKLVYSVAGVDGVFTNEMAAAIAAGVRTDTAANLPAGAKITGRLLVVNNAQQEAFSEAFEFTTLTDGSASVEPGLWQVFVTGGNGQWTYDAMSVAESEDWTSGRRRELGPIMAYVGGGPKAMSYTSELHGDSVYWPSNGGQWIYTGYIWLEQGKSYRFRTKIDDNEIIAITNIATGEEVFLVLDVGSSNAAQTSPVFTPVQSGYYPITIRLADGGSGLGGYDSSNSYKNTNNLGYSADGGTTWQMLLDPGDGSLLSTAEAKQALEIVSAIVQGEQLKVALLDGYGGITSVNAVWGPAYGGEVAENWAKTLANVASLDGTAGSMADVVIPGAAAARYVRFYGVNKAGKTVWSNSLFVPAVAEEGTAPTLALAGEPQVTGAKIAQQLSVISVGAGAETCDIYMVYGVESGIYTTTNLVATAAMAGAVTLDSGLLRALRTYYAAFFARNGSGDSALTDEIVFTTKADEEAATGGELPWIDNGSIVVTGIESGDTAVVSGKIAGGTSPYTVKIAFFGDNGDCDATVATYAGETSDGNFAIELYPVIPGKVNYYRVMVMDAAGKVDSLPVDAFTPRGAAAISTIASKKLNQRTLTVTAKLDQLGAGENYAYLLYSPMASNLTPADMIPFDGEPVKIESLETFTLTGILPAFATSNSDISYSVGIMVSNACSHVENGSYVSYVYSQSNNVDDWRVKDASVYTWKGVDGGSWNDPANWSSSIPDDCAGYPVHGSTARFNSSATVRITRNAYLNSIQTANAGTDVRFTAAGEVSLTIANELAPAEHTSVTFDERLRVYANGHFRLSPASAAEQWDEARINVIGGASVNLNSSGKYVYLAGTSTLFVSNATVNARRIYWSVNAPGGRLHLAGTSPMVTATEECRANDAKLGGGEIYATIPESGFAAVPFVYSATTLFGGADSTACTPVRLSVDQASPGIKRDGMHTFPLLSASTGVNLKRIAAGDLPNAATDTVKAATESASGPYFALDEATTAKHLAVEVLGTTPGRPVLRDLTLLTKSEDAATFSIVVTLGETASDATVKGILTWKSGDPAIDDEETIYTFDTVTASETLLTMSVSGLKPGANYTFAVEASSLPAGGDKRLSATAGPVAFATDALAPGAENPAFSNFRCTMTNESSAAFAYFGEKLGYGAKQYDLYFVYSHDEFVYTNLVASGAALGEQTLVFDNVFKPGTTYSALLYATNDVNGVFTSEPIAFATTPDSFLLPVYDLPDGFTALEYVESDGNQVVDTLLAPAEDWSFELDFAVTTVSAGNNQGLMGGDWGWDVTWLLQNNNGRLNFGTERIAVANIAKDVMYHLACSNGVATITGENLEASNSGHPMKFTRNSLALFAARVDGYQKSKMRLARFRIFAAGELKGDFVAACDASNVPCLYDLVSERAFYSTTSKALIAGPEKAMILKGELNAVAINFDGENLGGTLERQNSLDSATYAFVGKTYGGIDMEAWERKIAIDPAFEGELKRIGFYLTGLGEDRYVRFYTESDGFSPVVFLPELPVAANPYPAFTAAGVVESGATTLTLDATVLSRGTGAASCRMVAEYGTAEGVFDHSLVLAEDLLGRSRLTINALQPLTRYFIRLKAVNDLGNETLDETVFSATTLTRGTLGLTVEAAADDDAHFATQCREIALETGEKALVFTVATTNDSRIVATPAKFEVTAPGYAEVLVVGGGGATADTTYSGLGGGGGGGIVHIDSFYFDAGVYTLNVGRGGLVSDCSLTVDARRGSAQALPSIISNATEALVVAYPGGQGVGGTPTAGKWGSGAGVGANNNGDVASPYTAGQGNPGGGTQGLGVSGGGGGAGGAGGDAWLENGVLLHAGDGGDGLVFEITGQSICYGGGGGGSVKASTTGGGGSKGDVPGRGGMGGGGMGDGTLEEGGQGASGVDGLGGGAGAATDLRYYHGGAGTIILRFFPASADVSSPLVQLNSISPANDENNVPGVQLNALIVSEGAGAGVKVEFEYGLERDALDKSVMLAEQNFVGAQAYSFHGLLARQEYFGRLKVTDQAGHIAYSRTLAFTTLDGDDKAVSAGVARISKVDVAYGNAEHLATVTIEGTNLAVDGGETTLKMTLGDELATLKPHSDFKVVSIAPEKIVLFVDGFEFEHEYLAKFTVTTPASTAVSGVVAFRLAGESKVSTVTAAQDSANATDLVVSATCSVLGAGETKLALWVKNPGESTFVLVEEIVVEKTGQVDFKPLAYPFNTQVSYRVELANAYQDQSWSSRVADATIFIVDRTTYTWKDGTTGEWNDPACWTIGDGASTPCVGYPTSINNSGAKAVFAAGTSATVVLSEDYDGCASMKFGEGAKVTFKSSSGKALKMPVNGGISYQAGNEITLDGAAFLPGQNANVTLANNARFNLVNGGTTYSVNYAGLFINGANSVFAIGEDCSAGPFSQNQTRLAGEGAELLLEGVYTSSTTPFLLSYNADKPKGITFCGRKARFETRSSVYASGAAEGTLIFEIPEGGYDSIPLQGGQYVFGAMNATAFGSKIGIVVPADSPAALAEDEIDVQLIKWSGGINEAALDLGALPHPEDYYYYLRDSADVVTGLGVHILGRAAEPTAPVIKNLYLSESSAVSATVTGLFRLGGTSTSAVFSYRIARQDEEYPESWTQFLETSVITNVSSLAFADLAPGMAYKLALKGVNDAGETIVEYQFTTIGDQAKVRGAEGYASREYYGPYEIITYTNSAANGKLDIEFGGIAEVLVVGGGGAGGKGTGGGGGGGAVVYKNAMLLASGQYTIKVGAGGAATTSNGVKNNGESSCLFNAAGQILLEAAGGGGGGTFGSPNGNAGGNGGGGGSNGAGGAGLSGGYAGGAGVNGGGGGGGAGAEGQGADGRNPGPGGDGIPCAITGFEVYYGGGGAGGSADGDARKGVGGKGGGASTVTRDYNAPAGVDGLGGGGAGGTGSSSGASKFGGKGGDGVVIVRIRTIPATEAPIVQYRATTVEGNSATVETEVFDFGGDASSLTWKVVWGFLEDKLLYEHDAGSVDHIGIVNTKIDGLPHARLIFAKIVATSATTAKSFETPVFTFVTHGESSEWTDPAVPQVGDVAIGGAGGDTIDFAATVSSIPEGATSATIELWTSTTSNFVSFVCYPAQAANIGEKTSGVLHISDVESDLYIEPGKTYYATLVVRGNDGSVFSTPIAKVDTLAGSTFKSVSTSVSQSQVTVSGSLNTPVGCNDTVVKLRWSIDSGATWQEETIAMFNAASNTLSFAAKKDFGEFGVAVDFEIVAENSCETKSYRDVVAKSATTDDVATYTWKAKDGEWSGNWEDPEHWTASLEPNFGYPKSLGSKADFSKLPVDESVRVKLNGQYEIDSIAVLSTGSYRMVLEGGVPGAGLTLRNMGEYTMARSNSEFVLDAIYYRPRVNSGTGRSGFSMSGEGLVLRLVNGASMECAFFKLQSNNTRLELSGSSLVDCSGNLEINGAPSTITIDDSTLNVSNTICYFGGEPSIAKVIFKGKAPRLAVGRWEQPCRLRTNPDNFVFIVPEAGWARAPFCKDDESALGDGKFNSYNADCRYTREFSIDESSPAFRSGRSRAIVPLLSWKSGIAHTAIEDGLSTNIELKMPERFGSVRGIANRIFFVDADGNELSREAVDAGAEVYGISAEITGFGGTRIRIR